MSPSTATRVCDRLVDKKLVHRRTDADDRRSVRVDLTSRGRKLVEQVMQRRRALIADVLLRLSPQSRRRLADALVEFSNAAGEVSDGAWALGWPVPNGDDPDA